MAATAVVISEGRTVPYTPSSAVTAGDVVVQGELVGVAHNAIAANQKGALTVAGLIQFPKATTSGSAITAGANAYWDAGNEIATTTVGSNKLLGKVPVAAADDDSTVEVLMNQ